jgi:murein DD-endopeptidase MepM/ murein hydrolase activator NlpD
MRARCAFAALILSLGQTISLMAQKETAPLNLVLPTENDAIYRGDGAAFYQRIERDFLGVKTTPWEGGQYGFVRNPVQTAEGIIYTRFHEGIDIRPLLRDAHGEPLDEVHAIADGEVVHANLVAGFSNYGKYVVIEHHFGGSPYFSLYAHLREIDVQPGTRVARGQRIALMGYTGEGLNRERAHVHLELNLMLSRNFEAWYNRVSKNDPNRHGIYNGINLTGLDIARLYLALREHPALTIPEFLAQEEMFYRVRIPVSANFDLPKLYPWMVKNGTQEADAVSWEISFNRAGVPLKIEASSKQISEPELADIKQSSLSYSELTRGVVGGHGDRAFLTENGKRLMQLLSAF